MLRLIIRTGCTSRWLAFLIAIRLALKPAPCFIGESCCWALVGKGYFSSSTTTFCAQKCLFPPFLEDKTNYSPGTSPQLSPFGELQCQRALQRCNGWISSIWSTHANCAVLMDQSVQMPRPQSCCRQNVKILLLCLLCTCWKGSLQGRGGGGEGWSPSSSGVPSEKCFITYMFLSH